MAWPRSLDVNRWIQAKRKSPSNGSFPSPTSWTTWIENWPASPVINLLSNAAKYAPERSTVRVVVGPAAESELTIAMSDEGPGIEPAEAERIFEQWHRAPRETQPGLGLYIVSRIVELHGGTVVLESTPGQSSTVTVVLPL
jgi:signal transduction histidine kinase